MNDACKSKPMNGIHVQENGIIRNLGGQIIGRLVDGVGFNSPLLVGTNNIEPAMSALKQAMRDDPDYAHGWHCNIAMACYDSMSKGTEERDDSESYKNRRRDSNEAASRFMKLCFDVVTTQ